MESGKKLKPGKGRPPFGYRKSDNKVFVIEEELEALEQAEQYLQIWSWRRTAEWLEFKTGRHISHTGLRNRLKLGVRLEVENEKETTTIGRAEDSGGEGTGRDEESEGC